MNDEHIACCIKGYLAVVAADTGICTGDNQVADGGVGAYDNAVAYEVAVARVNAGEADERCFAAAGGGGAVDNDVGFCHNVVKRAVVVGCKAYDEIGDEQVIEHQTSYKASAEADAFSFVCNYAKIQNQLAWGSHGCTALKDCVVKRERDGGESGY